MILRDDHRGLSPRAPQPPAATMRAVLRRRYGGPEQVTVEAIATPEPGPDQVLLRVGAAGLDRATLHLLEGRPYVARLAFGLRRPRQPVLGQQVAGEIVAVGAGGGEFTVGERVFGVATGSMAEYAIASPAALTPTPAAVSDVEAATLGVSGMTALDAVERIGQVRAGQRVLVIGASGAVGGFAVQLAAHRGAKVTGVCSESKRDFVESLGAEATIDYRSTDVAQWGDRFDVIIDLAGNRRLSALRSVLSERGSLVIVGGEDGGAVLGGLQRNLAASVANRFTSQNLGWLFSRTTREGCARLGELVAQGALRPVVDRRVGLDGVADALDAMRRGTLRGHAVACPHPDDEA